RPRRSRGGAALAPVAPRQRARPPRRLPGAGGNGRADRRALLARTRLRRADRDAARAQATTSEGDVTPAEAARAAQIRRAGDVTAGRGTSRAERDDGRRAAADARAATARRAVAATALV